MLQLNDISLSQGKQRLLIETSFTLYEGEKMALIGRNGVGKSSLFSFILGHLQADQGEVKLKSDWVVAALAQELPVSDETSLSFVMQGDLAWYALSQQIDQALAEDNHDLLAELYDKMLAIDGYGTESRAAKILSGLGFSQGELQKSVNAFSGGWRMRIQLARVLISRADFILLDEPTNHLDLEAILWLEKWLINFSGTVLMISHDRAFLDNVAEGILHLQGQTITRYAGNYSRFEKQYLETKVLIQKENQKTEAKRAHLQQFVDRFKAKASKAKQAQGRIKMLEKLTVTVQMQEEGDFQFSFYPTESAGNPLISIRDGCFSYADKRIFSDLCLSINDGQRIGLIGPNGAGKSTFMAILAKALTLDAGEMNVNNRLNIGLFTQNHGDDLDQRLSPMETVMAFDHSFTEQSARNFLGRFNFRGDKVLEKLSTFSGGQRARLALALLVWQKPNMLLLDEPTNHLDLNVRESLMLALQDFQGTLIIISHDRALLNASVEEFWLVGDEKVQPFSGDLNDYALWFKAYSQEKLKPEAKGKKAPPVHDNNEPRQAGQEKKLQKLERDIEALKNKLAEVDVALGDPSLYENNNVKKRDDLQQKRESLVLLLAQKERDWLDCIG